MQFKKKVYESNYLLITLEPANDLSIQYWKQSPTTIDIFKKEMLAYASLYSQFTPSKSLWLQTNFALDLDEETHYWIEEKVNIPCKAYGNEKCAFVVSKNVLAHISVIESFDKVNSCIVVKHFLTEEDARKWLSPVLFQRKEPQKIEITYKGIDEDGNLLIKISNSKNNIKNIFQSLQQIIDRDRFIDTNLQQFTSLTKREKQVLECVIQGMQHKEISIGMKISLHTVRTHWRNIKEKLAIKNTPEISKYAAFFD